MQRTVSILAIPIVVVGLVAIVYGFTLRSERIVQPIAFNHVVHLEGAGMQCAECHTDATTSVSAGLPGKEICYNCHDIDEEAGTQPEKDKLFAFDDQDGDIPWMRVTVSTPDVFFSHRRHVTSGKLECTECHRDQRTLSAPPSSVRLVMSMYACIECHAEHGVSSDCLACHR